MKRKNRQIANLKNCQIKFGLASLRVILHTLNIILLITVLGITSISARELTEVEKIEYLIQKIRLSNLTFIRGGSEYNSVDAADHLQMKWNNAGKGRINTTDRFIKYIATKSSLLGTPYYIKDLSGQKIKSSDWLKAQLNQLQFTKK